MGLLRSGFVKEDLGTQQPSRLPRVLDKIEDEEHAAPMGDGGSSIHEHEVLGLTGTQVRPM
jgi:hypothetical protein